ncbi:MAG: hypothetical protein AB7G21_04515 [Dehalococcoidia bacterium]
MAQSTPRDFWNTALSGIDLDPAAATAQITRPPARRDEDDVLDSLSADEARRRGDAAGRRWASFDLSIAGDGFSALAAELVPALEVQLAELARPTHVGVFHRARPTRGACLRLAANGDDAERDLLLAIATAHAFLEHRSAYYVWRRTPDGLLECIGPDGDGGPLYWRPRERIEVLAFCEAFARVARLDLCLDALRDPAADPERARLEARRVQDAEWKARARRGEALIALGFPHGLAMKLGGAGYSSARELLQASDEDLLRIATIGPARLRLVRETAASALSAPPTPDP